MAPVVISTAGAGDQLIAAEDGGNILIGRRRCKRPHRAALGGRIDDRRHCAWTEYHETRTSTEEASGRTGGCVAVELFRCWAEKKTQVSGAGPLGRSRKTGLRVNDEQDAHRTLGFEI